MILQRGSGFGSLRLSRTCDADSRRVKNLLAKHPARTQEEARKVYKTRFLVEPDKP
jgi:hypothetical protein